MRVFEYVRTTGGLPCSIKGGVTFGPALIVSKKLEDCTKAMPSWMDIMEPPAPYLVSLGNTLEFSMII